MTSPPLPQNSKLTVWGLVEAGAMLACLATLTGFLGRFWWIFELTSHFRPQLAAALAALAALWTLKRRWRWRGFAAWGRWSTPCR